MKRFIAVTELTYAGQLIVARTYGAASVMMPIVLGYLLVCWPILLRQRPTELDSPVAYRFRGPL
ncbi:hypothetical protein LGR51_19465 [Pseudomonas sp. NP21570]|uniref:Uncharacterized protein n=1 Tax=Stutzerimonas zhaodongensis TaxID=1176257 RepID=A0ABX8J091_9GAMM|nr:MULTISPECIES: hypothetical protein [Pseudomonadaceae]MCB4796681.1 hypothetical protein [Pseudomonas sp. NP21570]MCO4020192.1 hypothetical protein [Pseudomonas aeruginosa]QWV19503.1 hypothetical protein KQ248_23030 [Stutzerimonas zhaodongensis]QWV19510.1 hypothetical protein KQ248_22470 [Stutzerimonas zhaodongensis]GCA54700.1 hypothetical protein PSCT_00872 [Pseudomonas sp. SCT]